MNQPARTEIIVGMPAYNEAKYIGSLVLQAKRHVDKVVVVDDGSTDTTASIARMAGAVVIRHEHNRGYGSTIQTLLNAAKQRNATILVILDADSQHDPDEIPRLIEGIKGGADIVIGSREMQQNKIAGYRRLGQWFLSRMTGLASQKKLTDTESGFRAYSRKAINSLELRETGMAVSSEIISAAASLGLKIAEVPISVAYTGDGSTLNPVKHGLGVFNRILIIISEKRPLLFFSLFGGINMAIGLATGITVIWIFYFGANVLATGLAMVSILFVTIGLLSIFTGIILNVLTKRINNQK
jgi:glycosyltransferase involved in cell wall biosynthesis